MDVDEKMEMTKLLQTELVVKHNWMVIASGKNEDTSVLMVRLWFEAFGDFARSGALFPAL